MLLAIAGLSDRYPSPPPLRELKYSLDSLQIGLLVGFMSLTSRFNVDLRKLGSCDIVQKH